MPKIPKIAYLFFFLTLFSIFVFFGFNKVFAGPGKSCGNAVCQTSLGEDCGTCPEDCGICNTPQPTVPPPPTPPPTNPPPTTTGEPQPTNPSETTPPSNDSTESSGTSSTTANYPSIALNNYSLYQNTNTVSYNGTALVLGSSISSLDYRLAEGGWNPATSLDGSFNTENEGFYINLGSFPDGSYTFSIRAKASNGLEKIETYSLVVITVPPEISFSETLDIPTNLENPVISGSITPPTFISSAQISLNGGKTFFNLNVAKNGRFSFTARNLEDGNYKIIVRVSDLAGNTTVSEARELVVDLLPPIIGGSMVNVGPQIIYPQDSGYVWTVDGVPTTLNIGTKGGVTKLTAIYEDKEVIFGKLGESNIFKGDIVFSTEGIKKILIKAEDGAGNRDESNLDYFYSLKQGSILDKNGEIIKDTKIHIYYFEESTESWVLWDAQPYGQANPIESSDGKYSIFVPPGRYYLRFTNPKYIKTETKIITFENTGIINTDVILKRKLISFFPNIIPQTINIFETDKKNALYDFSAEKILKDAGLIKGGENEIISIGSIWSAPSLEQFSIIGRLEDKNPEGFIPKVIFIQNSESEVESFIKRGKYDFAYVADEYGDRIKIENSYWLPLNVFVKNGEVVGYYSGVMDEKEIIERIGKFN